MRNLENKLSLFSLAEKKPKRGFVCLDEKLSFRSTDELASKRELVPKRQITFEYSKIRN